MTGYDGSPLSSQWAYRRFGILGDSLLAFRGPCHVEVADLADLEDFRSGAYIESRDMLHFIAEHFDANLGEGILRQYLLVNLLMDEINARQKKVRIRRNGNDLWAGQRKLSVSIAAPTTVSVKIHVGVNISSKGTPVPTLGLSDLKIAPLVLARAVLKRCAADAKALAKAQVKVRAYP